KHATAAWKQIHVVDDQRDDAEPIARSRLTCLMAISTDPHRCRRRLYIRRRESGAFVLLAASTPAPTAPIPLAASPPSIRLAAPAPPPPSRLLLSAPAPRIPPAASPPAPTPTP